jgi:regulator of replication initiation timing
VVNSSKIRENRIIATAEEIRRSCGPKVKHTTMETAREAVATMTAQGKNDGRLVAYECLFCDGFHVGHESGLSIAFDRARQAIFGGPRSCSTCFHCADLGAPGPMLCMRKQPGTPIASSRRGYGIECCTPSGIHWESAAIRGEPTCAATPQTSPDIHWENENLRQEILELRGQLSSQRFLVAANRAEVDKLRTREARLRDEMETLREEVKPALALWDLCEQLIK